MKTLIKSIKFSGYKAFENEVSIDFKTNKNKYNFNESVREFKRDNSSFFYNNHLGFIGPNSSGKTSILGILKIYSAFLNDGIKGVVGSRFIDPLMGQHDHSIAALLTTNDFNNNKESIDIIFESVNEKFIIIHQIKIKKDFEFSEKLKIKKLREKNQVQEKIFEKSFKDKISFTNFYELTNVTTKQKIFTTNLEFSKNDYKEIYNSLKELGNSIFSIGAQTTTRVWTNELNNYLTRNFENYEFIEKIQNFIKVIAQSVDPKIEEVEIEEVIRNNFMKFNFNFILKNHQKISHHSLSDGTWKIIGIFVKLYLLNQQKHSNLYILLDEMDNSWHPNLTRIFLRMVKNNLFSNIVFLFTFHNPYIAEEVRNDALYLVLASQEVLTWPNQVKIFNDDKEQRKLRLENSFQNKYLDEIICSGPESFKVDVIFDFFEEK